MGQWPPHPCAKLSKAIGFHTVPAVDLWKFVNEVYELLPCAREWARFPKGEKNVLDFRHLFVCLWKRARKLWQKMRIVGEYISFRDKPYDSLVMPCFSGEPCDLGSNLILGKEEKELLFIIYTHAVPDTVLGIL